MNTQKEMENQDESMEGSLQICYLHNRIQMTF